MPDREKVIRGLEICFTPEAKCRDCPYDPDGFVPACTKALVKDAIALLKEYQHEKERKPVIVCPHCGKRVV